VQIARRRVDGPAHCRRPPAHRGGAEAALGGLSSVEARGDFDGVTDPKEVLKRFDAPETDPRFLCETSRRLRRRTKASSPEQL
jgi:hypothetical protein